MGAGSYGCSSEKVAINWEREMLAGSILIGCDRFVEHPDSRVGMVWQNLIDRIKLFLPLSSQLLIM